MTDNDRDVVQRVHEIMERFEKDPALQQKVIEQMQREGIIDDRGQVICLGGVENNGTPANGTAK